MSLASQPLSQKPKTSNLVLQFREHVGLLVTRGQVAALVADQQ